MHRAKWHRLAPNMASRMALSHEAWDRETGPKQEIEPHKRFTNFRSIGQKKGLDPEQPPHQNQTYFISLMRVFIDPHSGRELCDAIFSKCIKLIITLKYYKQCQLLCMENLWNSVDNVC